MKNEIASFKGKNAIGNMYFMNNVKKYKKSNKAFKLNNKFLEYEKNFVKVKSYKFEDVIRNE